MGTTTTMGVRVIGPGVQAIDIAGDVTAGSENALMDAYTEASAAGSRAIVLNFSRLDYMNSSGIGVLVTILIRANRQGRRLGAVGLSEHYRQIFELTRLDEAIPVFATEDEASRALLRKEDER